MRTQMLDKLTRYNIMKYPRAAWSVVFTRT